MRKRQRWGNQHAMALRRKHHSLTRFLACFKKPTNRLFMSIALSYKVSFSALLEIFWYAYCATVDSFVIVSFFIEIHYIPQYYRWLTCYVCARLCQSFGQGGCYFRCDKACTCDYTCTQPVAVLRGALGGPWPSHIFDWPPACPPFFCLISRSSSFDWHIQQITFSQQNFKRFENFLATVLTIFTSLCWVW